jgi:hypothetical protein
MIDIHKLDYNSVSIWNMNYTITEYNVNKIKDMFVSELKTSRFCPAKIRDYAEKCNKYIHVSCGPITLHLLYVDTLHENLYKILRTLKHCILIHNFFNMTEAFNIYIMFSPYKRYIYQNKPIDVININGGFTNPNENKIFIIRQEEYAKVIIHEMLHHVKSIHHDHWSVSDIAELKKTFNIAEQTVLIPNEAVVELWATLFFISFMSSEYNIKFKTLLQSELKHSLYQTSKILKKQGNNPWTEYSNAYCYIVFKTILLHAYINNILPDNTPHDITRYLILHKTDLPKYIHRNTPDKSLRMMKLSDL